MVNSLHNEMQVAIREDSLRVVFVWTPSQECLFRKIHLKQGTHDPVDVLRTQRVDDSGIKGFSLGRFSALTLLDVSFEIQGNTDVNKIFAVIMQPDVRYSVQAAPDPRNYPPTSSIVSGGAWTSSFKYRTHMVALNNLVAKLLGSF